MGKANRRASTRDEDREIIFRRLSRDCALNIQFADLSYEVKLRNEKKIILNNITGEFRSGELSVIIGPSGSGKTTLINLLAGYRIRKTSGRIEVNDKLENVNRLRKLSRYIFQEDCISSKFTILETMKYASRFKLNNNFTPSERQKVINEYLNIFLLTDKAHTRISDISGGERKRLCVALELLNNPAVLFLDEPTTGLDEFSATQCVTLLKRLADSGRTVVCSAHCPSARLLQMFNKVYVLSEGQCIYQGTVNGIVPYLQHFQLTCPITHNPADYIIEVATNFYGNYHNDLVNAIQNGKISKWSPVIAENQQNHRPCVYDSVDDDSPDFGTYEWKTAWIIEYLWIFCRIIHQMWRDKTNIKLMVFTNIFLSVILGVTYHNIGNDAVYGLFNYNLVVLISVMFLFLAMSPMLAYVPQEMQYLRREHFNQWYRLSSYFMALVSCQMVVSFIMSLLASSIIYVLCNQPLELFRFMLFFLIAWLTFLTASSYGMLIGSRMRLLNALFMGPNIAAVWIMLANYSVEKAYLHTWEKVLMYSSFIRHTFEGAMIALFDFNRSDFVCPPNIVLCLVTKPKLLLKISGIPDPSYVQAALFLLGFYILFTTLSFVVFKCRLSSFELLQRNSLYQYMRYLQSKYVFGES
uniref:ABC transporter domain-containing protein n=1 Tax=Stomoxys calcitrans TaxID=35570 RepID=A0A1I8P001_STOCA